MYKCIYIYMYLIKLYIYKCIYIRERERENYIFKCLYHQKVILLSQMVCISCLEKQ